MNTKLPMRKNSKVKIISLVLIFAVCLSMIPMLSLGAEPADGNNIGQTVTGGSNKVDFGAVDVYWYDYSSKKYLPYIQNGNYVNTDSTGKPYAKKNSDGTYRYFELGDSVRFEVNWSISSANMASVNEGDWFRVKLPNDLFRFAGVANAPLDVEGVERGKFSLINEGTWQDPDYYMQIILTDIYNTPGSPGSGKINGLKDGLMYAEGTATSVNDGKDNIVIAGKTIKGIPIDNGNKVEFEPAWDEPYTFYKNGWGTHFDNTIKEYTLNVNQQDYYQALLGNSSSIKKKKDILIEDTVPEGTRLAEDPWGEYDKISFFLQANVVADGVVVSDFMGWIRFEHNFKEFKQGTYTDYATFKEELIKAAKNDGLPRWGTFNDKSFIVFVPNDLPGTVKSTGFGDYIYDDITKKYVYYKGDAYIGALYDDWLKNFTPEERAKIPVTVKQETVNAYKNIFDSNGAGTLPGFSINYYLEVIDGGERYLVNEAKMSWDEGTKTVIRDDVKFEGGGAWAKPIPWDSIELKKIDSVTKEVMPNVEFSIQTVTGTDKNPIFTTKQTKKTNADGIVTFGGLSAGKYKIIESAPTGYESNFKLLYDNSAGGQTKGEEVKDGIFVLASGQEGGGFKFLCENTPKKGSIQLTKRDQANANTLLAGVKFKLQVKNSSGGWDDYNSGATQTSNTSGLVTFSDLPWGTYRIVEVDAATNYDKDTFKIAKSGSTTYTDAKTTEIVIDARVTGQQNYIFNGVNSKLGSIVLKKVDEDGTSPLSGGVFSLKDKDGKVVATTSAIAGTGEIKFDKVPHGTYTIEETTAPQGYDKSKMTYLNSFNGSFEIKDGQLNITQTAKNARLTGTIDLTKYNTGTTTLNGAIFKLVTKNSKGEWVDYTGTGATQTSANGGKVTFKGLPWGEYKIVETTAVSGYDANSFKIKAKNDPASEYKAADQFIITVGKEAQSFVLDGQNQKLGKITLTKYDTTVKNTLANVTFKLMVEESPGNWVEYGSTAQASSKGVVTFSNLPWGNYKIVEVTPYSGYDKDSLKIRNGSTGTFTPAKDFIITVGETTQEFTLQGTNGKLGSFELTKKDEKGTLLSGGVFTLYKDGEFYASTSAIAGTGKVTFSKLPLGSYRLEETVAPDGYDKGSLTYTAGTGTFEITDGQSITATASNSTIKGSIDLTKVDTSGAAISGATFTLYAKNGTSFYPYTGPGATATTGPDGKISFTNLPWNDYKIVETKADSYDISMFKIKAKGDAADKYVKADGFIITVGKDKQSFELDGVNSKLGSFELTKYGDDKTTKLSGGEFVLRENDKNGKIVATTSAAALTGKVTFTGLPHGTYFIEEKTAPEGYGGSLKFDTGFNNPFTINDNNISIKVNGYNDQTKGTLIIEKYDSVVTTKALSGAGFYLEKWNSTSNKWETYKIDNTTVAGIDNGDGTYKFENLPWDKYRVKEQTPPAGYKADTLTFAEGNGEFTVNAKAQSGRIVAYNVEEEYSFNISIEKYTNDGGTKLLSGAGFKLYSDPECETEVFEETFITNHTGYITLQPIPAGTYYLKEVQSPEGYKLLANPIKVEIVKSENGNLSGKFDLKIEGTKIDISDETYKTRVLENKNNAVISIENYKGFNLPMTGGMGILMFLAIGLIGILSVSIVIMRRRRKVTA